MIEQTSFLNHSRSIGQSGQSIFPIRAAIAVIHLIVSLALRIFNYIHHLFFIYDDTKGDLKPTTMVVGPAAVTPTLIQQKDIVQKGPSKNDGKKDADTLTDDTALAATTIVAAAILQQPKKDVAGAGSLSSSSPIIEVIEDDDLDDSKFFDAEDLSKPPLTEDPSSQAAASSSSSTSTTSSPSATGPQLSNSMLECCFPLFSEDKTGSISQQGAKNWLFAIVESTSPVTPDSTKLKYTITLEDKEYQAEVVLNPNIEQDPTHPNIMIWKDGVVPSKTFKGAEARQTLIELLSNASFPLNPEFGRSTIEKLIPSNMISCTIRMDGSFEIEYAAEQSTTLDISKLAPNPVVSMANIIFAKTMRGKVDLKNGGIEFTLDSITAGRLTCWLAIEKITCSSSRADPEKNEAAAAAPMKEGIVAIVPWLKRGNKVPGTWATYEWIRDESKPPEVKFLSEADTAQTFAAIVWA